MLERITRFLRGLPAVILRVACFSVPAFMIAVGIVVPVLLAAAALAIVLVNEPGTVYDTELIPDLVRVGVGVFLLGALAYVTFLLAGSRRRLKAGLAAAPGMLAGAVLLLVLLGSAIVLQGALKTDDRIQSRTEATIWLLSIGLVASAALVWPVVWTLRKWGKVKVVHPWMSLFAWAGIAWLLLANIGEPPEAPEAAAAKAAKKEEAVRRGSPPPTDAAELAFKHRPLLLFDLGERRPPLDVDEFLAERGRDGEPSHEVCSETALAYDCSRVSSAADLRSRSADPNAVIAIDVNPAERPPTAQRMYYHVDADDPDGRVHLDYWIFYRYNDSPKFSKYTCLSGLSVRDMTCFDHEGDWEGITVSLTRDRKPESVVYVGHHWRYRFAWQDLEKLGVVVDGRPQVWVATGSHASYPGECANRIRQDGHLVKVSCRQPGRDTPDGDRDGDKPWPCEHEDCLRPLPLTAMGKPMGWAAFAGYWGAARCTVGTRLCTRSRGPDTPAFQGRYADPGGKGADREVLRQWYGDAIDKLPPIDGA